MLEVTKLMGGCRPPSHPEGSVSQVIYASQTLLAKSVPCASVLYHVITRNTPDHGGYCLVLGACGRVAVDGSTISSELHNGPSGDNVIGAAMIPG